MKYFVPRQPLSAATRLTARLMIAALLWSNGMGAVLQAALAGPIADPAAPLAFRPTVGQAANGVPVVNITAPNAAGLSLNQYQRFNVDGQGAILNNSLVGGNALLGPGVAANPNLSGGSTARTIVNEVTQAGGPSVLGGTLEVFGAPASVIIANPWGITCAGCGVLNTPRLSLITAAPRPLDGSGQAVPFANALNLGWDIQGGQIVITSRGLEGTVGRLDLLGQTLQIDGPLRAHYLNQDLSSINLGAGPQQIQLLTDGNYSTNGAAAGNTLKAVNGSVGGVPATASARQPAFAIDASALGAMTAGQIHIVSTAEGLGVNLRGPLVAYQQGIRIQSNGALTVGDASAVGDVSLSSAGNLAATQNLHAGGNLSIASSGGNVGLNGNTSAVGNVQLQSGQSTNASGVLQAGGVLHATSGGSIGLGGNTTAVGNVQLQSGKDIHIGGALQTGANLGVVAGNAISPGAVRIDGDVQVQRDMQVQGTDIAVDGKLTIGNSYTAQASRTLVQGGQATVGNTLSLQAQAVALGGTVRAPLTQISGDSLVLGQGGATSVTGNLQADIRGSVAGRGPLSVQGSTSIASTGDQTYSGPVHASGALALQAGGNLSVDGASAGSSALLVSGGNLRIDGTVSGSDIKAIGQSATVNGAVSSTGDVLLAATGGGQNLTLNGSVRADGNISAHANGSVLANGSITSTGATLLDAGGAVQVGGSISASSMTLSGASISIPGALNSPGSISLASVESLDIAGNVNTGGSLNLQTGGNLTLPGSVTSGGSTTLVADGDLSVHGSVQATSINASAGRNASFGGNLTASSGAIQLGAGNTLAISGAVTAMGPAGAIDIQSIGSLGVAGDLQAAGSARLVANGNAILGGSITSGGSTVVQAGGDLQLAGSSTSLAGQTLHAVGNLFVQGNLQAGALDVNGQNVHLGGSADVGGGTRLQAADTLAVDGHLRSGGDIAAIAGGGATLQHVVGNGNVAIASQGSIHAASLVAGGNLGADASAGLHVQGVLGANGNLQASAGQAIAVGGPVQSGGPLHLVAGQDIDLHSDLLGSGATTLRSTAGRIAIAGNTQAQGDIAIDGQALQLHGAQTDGQLQLNARSGDLLAQGSLSSRGHLQAQANGDLSVQGGVQTQGDLLAKAGGALGVGQDTVVNGFARLQAGGDIQGGGVLQAGSGLQAAAGGNIVQQGATLVLGDATVASGGAQEWGQAAQHGIGVSGKLTSTAGKGIVVGGALQANQGIQLTAGTGGVTGGISVGGAVGTGANAELKALGDIQLGTTVQDSTTVQGNLAATSTGGSIGFAGQLGVQGDLSANAQQNLRFLGNTTVLGQAQMQVQSGQIHNAGTMNLAQGLAINTQGDFVNEGLVKTPGDIQIQARNIRSNTGPQSVAQGGLVTQGRMTLAAGQGIAFGAPATVSAAAGMELSSTAGVGNSGKVQSGTSLDVTGSYSNSGATALTAAQGIAITGSLWNSGTVYANNVHVAQATTNDGQLGATTMALGSLSNSGVVSAETLTTGPAGNTGTIAGSSITIQGGLGNSGSVAASGDLSIGGGSVDNNGYLAGHAVGISGPMVRNGGQIVASGNLSLSGGSLINSGGESVTCISGNCTWTQSSASISAGTINASFDSIANSGVISSHGDATFSANSFANQRKVANLTPTATGGSADTTANISAGGNITVSAATIANSGGSIHAGSALALNASGGVSSTALQPGMAGKLTGKSVTISGANIANEGVLQATGGDATLTSAAGIANNGADAVIVASGDVALTATGSVGNQGGARLLADGKINVQGGSFANAGTVYGVSGPASDIRISTTGGISNSGILIAGSTLELQGASYANGGTVGSLGNAKLVTPAAYAPTAAPLLALGHLDLQVGGIHVGQNSGWTSGAANTTWAGTLTNYGSVYLAGDASGAVANLAGSSAGYAGDPVVLPASMYYYTGPSTLTDAQAIGYTDVSSRAFFGVGGSFTGSIENKASDVAAGGAYTYIDSNVDQSVTWSGKDAQGNTATEVTAAISRPRLVTGPGATTLTLPTPTVGSIVADSLTIIGTSLTVGAGIDASGAQQGVANAQSTQVGTGGISLAGAVAGGVAASTGTVTATADLEHAQDLPVASALAGSHIVSAKGPAPATVGGNGMPEGLPAPGSASAAISMPRPGAGGSLGLDLSSPQAGVAALLAGTVQPVYPDWNQLRVVPGSISANDLNLQLSGTFTNLGFFSVANNLVIDAAGGIDNSGAALKAGGSVQLFGAGLDNRGGRIDAGSLLADIRGNLTNQGGTLQATGDLLLRADGDLSAQNSSMASSAGNVQIKAQGGIDAAMARIRAAGDVDLDADGTVHLKGAGGTAALEAGGKLNLRSGADLDIAGMTLDASKGVTIASNGSIQADRASISSSQGNASLTAKQGIDFTAARLSAEQGEARLSAGGSLHLGAISNTSETRQTGTVEDIRYACIDGNDCGYRAVDVRRTQSRASATFVQGSQIGGQTVVLGAGQNIDMTAASVRGTQGVDIKAGGAISINAGQTANSASTRTDRSKDASSSQSEGWAGSQIASSAGDVRIVANTAKQGGALSVSGSDIRAAGQLTLQGQDVSVQARQAHSQGQSVSGGAQQSQEKWTTSGGTLHGGNGVSVVADGQDGKSGGTVALQGASVQSGGDLVVAGADIRIAANVDRSVQADQKGGGSNYTKSSSDTQSIAGGTLQAAGDITLMATGNAQSRGDIVLQGARIGAGRETLGVKPEDVSSTGPASHGNLSIVAAGSVQLQATATRNHIETETRSKKSGFLSSKKKLDATMSDELAQNGVELSGNNVTLLAKRGDIDAAGASVDARSTASLQAAGDVNLGVATQTAQSSERHEQSRSGLSVSFKGISVGRSAASAQGAGNGVTQLGSSVSAGKVDISAGRDVNVVDSAVLSDTDIAIEAGRDINLLAAYDTVQSTSQSHSSGWGIGLGGMLTGLNYTRTNQNGTGDGATAATSLLSANAGSVTLAAGTDAQYQSTGQGKVVMQGADILAKDKVAISANAVDLQAVHDSTASTYHMDSRSISIDSVKLTGVVGGLLQEGIDRATQGSSGNDRLDAARALKFGYDLYKNADKLQAAISGTGTGMAELGSAMAGGESAQVIQAGAGATVGVSVSSQFTQSRADSSSTANTARGTNIQAGSIDIRSTVGDIAMAGAKLQATDISLSAAQNLNLGAASSTASTQSSSKGSGFGGGATFGGGAQNGISFQGNASVSRSQANGSETVHDNTLVTATNGVRLQSGADTNLIGAQVGGQRVTAEVGGNLNIQTLQDQSEYHSRSSSAGFSVSVCVPPICYGSVVTGSVNVASSTIEHNYQSAVGQSGIAAGEGGFDIKVQGGTTLTGGAITSTATPDKNSLRTASLTSTDVQNQQKTDASSSSISASYSGGNVASTVLANVAGNVMGNLAGQVGLPESGSQQGTTQSVVSAGTVTITGTSDAGRDQQSAQSVAMLTGRDAATANGSLKNTLNLQQAAQIAQDQQRAQQNAQAAALVGQVLDTAIGDLSKDKWPEGSPEKTILHGVSGLVQASLGGTNALSGFAAGVVNEQIVQAVSSYLIEQGVTDPRAYAEFMTAATTLVGAGVGALTGGGKAGNAVAGGSIAGTATTYNHLKHPSQIREPGVRDRILAAAQDCKGQASCAAMVAGLDGQIALLSDDKIAVMCVGDASCVADRITERNTYIDARGLATVKLDPNTAAIAFINSQSNSPYTKGEIAAAVTRIQNGTADPGSPLDAFVRNGMDPVMLAAVLGISVIDGDGGGRGTQGGSPVKPNGGPGTKPSVVTNGIGGSGDNSGANGGASIPSGMKPINIDGLPAGSQGVVDLATGEVKVLTSTGKLIDIPAAPIPSNLNATVVPQSTTGIKWGAGIQDQGLPFENYLATKLPVDTRLPEKFQTFDFYDPVTRTATSAKTLDTATVAKINDPSQIYYSIKGNVDDVVNFSGYSLSGATVNSANVNNRVLELAVPSGTTTAQWMQIQRAVQYGQANGVSVNVTVVK